MARFRGTVQGNRSEASRLGHPKDGLRVEANGWNGGVRVYAEANGDADTFHVYATGGSNGYTLDRYLATIKVAPDGTRTIVPVVKELTTD